MKLTITSATGLWGLLLAAGSLCLSDGSTTPKPSDPQHDPARIRVQVPVNVIAALNITPPVPVLSEKQILLQEVDADPKLKAHIEMTRWYRDFTSTWGLITCETFKIHLQHAREIEKELKANPDIERNLSAMPSWNGYSNGDVTPHIMRYVELPAFKEIQNFAHDHQTDYISITLDPRWTVTESGFPISAAARNLLIKEFIGKRDVSNAK